MVSGLGTGTLHLLDHGNAHEKGREMKTQPHPRAQDGDTHGSPLPQPKGICGSPPHPAHQARVIACHMGLEEWGLAAPELPVSDQ